jgi:catechol 2,3-dioxygenase-like lactoylglutathione lyase family enzyme
VAEWAKQIMAINLLVGNLDRSTAFYTKVFGMLPGYQDEHTAMFRFADTYVFLQRGQAHEDAPADEVLELSLLVHPGRNNVQGAL